MDDNKFDDIIKHKIGEYEDPQFDPSALSALHTNKFFDIGIGDCVHYAALIFRARRAPAPRLGGILSAQVTIFVGPL